MARVRESLAGVALGCGVHGRGRSARKRGPCSSPSTGGPVGASGLSRTPTCTRPSPTERQPLGALVAGAVKHGCQAVAVADHADRQLRGASPEYMAAVKAARAAHPDTIVIAGLEWNVPPRAGDEHATVLVPDTIDEEAVLAEFKQRWDDYDRVDRAEGDGGGSPALAR